MELLDTDFDDRLKKKIGNQFCQPLVHYFSLEGKAAEARNTAATAFASIATATTNRKTVCF
jgi:hypothetical protein